jgi:membrane protein
MGLRPVAALLAIQRAYDAAGGNMLSAGLSFFALFTLAPGLVLLASLLGWFIADPVTRETMLEAVVAQAEPLEDVARTVLDGLAGTAQAGTLIGLAGFLWGASGFYGALQAAMQRMFPGPRERDAIQTRVLGVIAVAAVMGAVVFAVVVGLAVPLVLDVLGLSVGRLSMVSPAVDAAVAAIACLVLYVAVAPNGPGVRVAAAPAIGAGIAIGLLTAVFGLLAPVILRHAPALGLLGAVFVALVWLDFVFRIVLYGGAVARLRLDRARDE